MLYGFLGIVFVVVLELGSFWTLWFSVLVLKGGLRGIWLVVLESGWVFIIVVLSLFGVQSHRRVFVGPNSGCGSGAREVVRRRIGDVLLLSGGCVYGILIIVKFVDCFEIWLFTVVQSRLVFFLGVRAVDASVTEGWNRVVMARNSVLWGRIDWMSTLSCFIVIS
jgi:hypothetical protein